METPSDSPVCSPSPIFSHFINQRDMRFAKMASTPVQQIVFSEQKCLKSPSYLPESNGQDSSLFTVYGDSEVGTGSKTALLSRPHGDVEEPGEPLQLLTSEEASSPTFAMSSTEKRKREEEESERLAWSLMEQEQHEAYNMQLQYFQGIQENNEGNLICLAKLGLPYSAVRYWGR
jgi:hypothetical protein